MVTLVTGALVTPWTHAKFEVIYLSMAFLHVDRVTRIDAISGPAGRL